MKICILHRYPLSEIKETNPSFSLFVDKLLSAGHKVFFVSCRKGEEYFPNKNVIYKELSFKIDRSSPKDKLFKSLLFILAAPFKVCQLCKKEHLDLVYCDDSLPFYGYLIKTIVKTKTIIRLGDLQTAYMFADRGKVGKFLFKILFAFERHMWRKVDRIIAISDAFKTFLVDNGIQESKIGVVPESIEVEMFRAQTSTVEIRKRYGINNDILLIMFHGVITRCKGLSTLLRAVPLIFKQFPAAKFMIIGDGPELLE